MKIGYVPSFVGALDGVPVCDESGQGIWWYFFLWWWNRYRKAANALVVSLLIHKISMVSYDHTYNAYGLYKNAVPSSETGYHGLEKRFKINQLFTMNTW